MIVFNPIFLMKAQSHFLFSISKEIGIRPLIKIKKGYENFSLQFNTGPVPFFGQMATSTLLI